MSRQYDHVCSANHGRRAKDPSSRRRITLEKIDKLTQLLNNNEPLSTEWRRELYSAFSRRVVGKMLDDGVSYGKASDAPEFYNQDYQAFRGHLRKTDQDLGWQCDSVRDAFSGYLKTGEIPAPYFPMRIAILLRKAKETEREKMFLTAWCRHFGTGNPSSGKYYKLSERLQKLNSKTSN